MQQPRKIFILDIDGTLMRTHEIDNECYWCAIRDVLGPHEQSVDLGDYAHVSDSGILRQWCRRALGRSPHDEEIGRLRTRFLDLLESVSRNQPDLFEPLPGVEEWLQRMRSRPGTHVAIATGSWHSTARFKLSRSGLSRFGLALATADDAFSRTDIMQTALSRLALEPPIARGDVIYVGDGPWDLRASQELGWNFIGIAEGERAEALRDLGAEQVHADFRPLVAH